MALIDEYNLSQDATFKGRVAMVAERKAVAIATESSAGLYPPRKRLAIRVLQDPISATVGLAILVARDPVIAALTPPTNANVTDVMITNALTDPLWNGYAEAFTS